MNVNAPLDTVAEPVFEPFAQVDQFTGTGVPDPEPITADGASFEHWRTRVPAAVPSVNEAWIEPDTICCASTTTEFFAPAVFA